MRRVWTGGMPLLILRIRPFIRGMCQGKSVKSIKKWDVLTRETNNIHAIKWIFWIFFGDIKNVFFCFCFFCQSKLTRWLKGSTCQTSADVITHFIRQHKYIWKISENRTCFEGRSSKELKSSICWEIVFDGKYATDNRKYWILKIPENVWLRQMTLEAIAKKPITFSPLTWHAWVRSVKCAP